MIVRPGTLRRQPSEARVTLAPALAFTFMAAFVLQVLAATAQGAAAQPPAPTAVEAVALDPTTIRVYWNPTPGATAYAIHRDGEPLGRASANATQYDDATAIVKRRHVYTVAAINDGGEGVESLPAVERTDAALPASLRCDLLVVGATTGGVAAAVTAARYGLDVVLVEETRRLGGMSVNGLGASDIRRVEHSSGFFEEFRRGVQDYYGSGNGLRYEPRVAHEVMKRLIWEHPRLTVFRQTRPLAVGTSPKAPAGRTQRSSEARAIVWVGVEHVPGGARCRITPRLVVDATECGDVAAWAGVPYRVGREARSRRELHAGHIYYDRSRDQVMQNSTGRADRRLQAYSYLMTVKDFGPGADRTIEKPEGYDIEKYRHAPPWPRSWNATSGKLPNDKYEINQHPYGSDLQGVNYDYPEASYERRRELERLFKLHALGYLYYIQTHEGLKQIGLSEDDFRADDGWPPLLYIREARRFESDTVMDESDILTARSLVRPDAIGLGDYAMDSHATQPKTDPTTPDMGEGEFYLPQYTPWHQVPFRIMIPRVVDNLFIATAVSATHVAYGTYRMEPVRMHFGAAAGVAAALCLRYDLRPREAPVNQVQSELLKQERGTSATPARDGSGAPGPLARPVLLYKFPDVTPKTPGFRSIQWLGARGFFPCSTPRERTPAAQLAADPFRPDDALTGRDLKRLLSILACRAEAVGEHIAAAATTVPDDSEITRAGAARALADAFGWAAPGGASTYADLAEGSEDWQAAEALRAHGIDVEVWGVFQARNRQGRHIFSPEMKISRRQFAVWLHLAHRFIGPLFFDHPLDRLPSLSAQSPCQTASFGLE